MSARNKLDAVNLKKLACGQWAWDGGIGYRRHKSGDGGTWYSKYRAPLPGRYSDSISPPTRQVKERLPNCRNRSQAEGVLMARKATIFEGTYQRKRKAEPTTLKSFAPRFLETKRHLRTVKKYRQQLNQQDVPYQP